MYDAAIIGTGPAGLSAALNLKLHNKSILWFGDPAFSKKVEKSEAIANYPGFSTLSGPQLNRQFAQQAREMGLEITDQLVTAIMPMGDSFSLLAANEVYQAKTILLALGSVTAKPLPGEEALLGRGVSYCATCDGFLYKGKTIAVLCTDPKYHHEVEYLAQLAEKVYLYTPYREPGLALPNLEQLPSPIGEILGEGRVDRLALKDGSTLAVEGLFILRSSVAPASLLNGLALEGPHIRTDRQMATNIPGCFAAGDCTGRPYQIAKAVGEGNIAAHSMVEYLSTLKG